VATRQVIVSDISQQEVPEDQHVRAVVEHPDFNFPLEIDVSAEEAERFQETPLRLVHVTVHAPGAAPRRVTIETKTLDRLFGSGVDFTKVLESARRADPRTPPSQRARAQATRSASPAAGDKRDYSSPQWAGVEHRGRVTEAEAAWVRDHLDQANENRAREGQAPISRDDPKMIKRYGF